MAFQYLKRTFRNLESDFLHGQIVMGQREITVKKGGFSLGVKSFSVVVVKYWNRFLKL